MLIVSFQSHAPVFRLSFGFPCVVTKPHETPQPCNMHQSGVETPEKVGTLSGGILYKAQIAFTIVGTSSSSWTAFAFVSEGLPRCMFYEAKTSNGEEGNHNGDALPCDHCYDPLVGDCSDCQNDLPVDARQYWLSALDSQLRLIVQE